jgi:hypothetical protein
MTTSADWPDFITEVLQLDEDTNAGASLECLLH